MEHIDEIIAENKEILKKLNEGNIDRVKINTVDLFRGELLNFIHSQLDPIAYTQKMIDLVDAEIVKKLMLHEYDKNELLDVRNMLVQNANTRTSVLLDPFKPTNGGGNTLITPPSESSNGADDLLKSISSNERIALDKLYRILMSKKEKETEPMRKVGEEE